MRQLMLTAKTTMHPAASPRRNYMLDASAAIRQPHHKPAQCPLCSESDRSAALSRNDAMGQRGTSRVIFKCHRNRRLTHPKKARRGSDRASDYRSAEFGTKLTCRDFDGSPRRGRFDATTLWHFAGGVVWSDRRRGGPPRWVMQARWPALQE
jgi:hypothetical protein